MKRILIIGISGSGKSHMARRMHMATELPLIHLDSIFWKENWVEVSESEVQDAVLAEVQNERWIIEGYIEPCSVQRLERADEVLYLDCSGITAVLGVLRRVLKHHRRPRPEMPAGNNDVLDLSFLRSVYTRQERQEIESKIEGYEDKVIRVKSRKAAKKYLDELSSRIESH